MHKTPLPKTLVVDHFIYKIPKFNKLHLGKVDPTQNVWGCPIKVKYCYEIGGLEELEKDYTNCIFLYEEKAYKITKVEVGYSSDESKSKLFVATDYLDLYFTIESYSDDNLTNLLARLKLTKEHILVCTDCIEELGSTKVAAYLRGYAEGLDLEDLV
jgi:hypothetical protein